MSSPGHRILIVDDNRAIHGDFNKILAPAKPAAAKSLEALEAALFDVEPATRPDAASFELVSAYQGTDGVELARAAVHAKNPFALAFVDMRMPPGIDGLETIERLWQIDPDLQIVVCSAYSDTSWAELQARVGERDSLLILKKPFDTIEVVQAAHALAIKWALARQVRMHVDDLEAAVRSRTAELQRANEHLAEHIRDRERIEAELRLSQKLEAIGQLAAGIAHEINTPIQYVGTSAVFVREAIGELVAATGQLLELARAERTPETAGLVDRLLALVDALDVDTLTRELPGSLDAIDDGIARITKIMRAMRELAHPGSSTAAAVDLEHALENALEVTAASYRYVADVALDFGNTPKVTCHLSELNQVFVNLIVNAAHAMEGRPQRGTLGIRTRQDGDVVEIAISDTGCGIAEAHRDKIFNAFFTTKDVGRGTGQGLAIARSIVVDRHGGSLTFDSTVDVGTTFRIRLPIKR